MKLTGRQLFEWWDAAVVHACFGQDFPVQPCHGPENELEQKAWDALAEKLNGMMAGPLVAEVSTLDGVELRPGPIIPVPDSLLCRDPNHHRASCPYRHGGENCTC